MLPSENTGETTNSMIISWHIQIYTQEFTDNKLSIKYIFLYDNLLLKT